MKWADARNERSETIDQCTARLEENYRGANEALQRATTCIMFYERYAEHSVKAFEHLIFWKMVVHSLEIKHEARARLNSPNKEA
jgi:hypothetical protein